LENRPWRAIAGGLLALDGVDTLRAHRLLAVRSPVLVAELDSGLTSYLVHVIELAIPDAVREGIPLLRRES